MHTVSTTHKQGIIRIKYYSIPEDLSKDKKTSPEQKALLATTTNTITFTLLYQQRNRWPSSRVFFGASWPILTLYTMIIGKHHKGFYSRKQLMGSIISAPILPIHGDSPVYQAGLPKKKN